MIFVNSMSDLFHKDDSEIAHRRRVRHDGKAPTGTFIRCSPSAARYCRNSSTSVTQPAPPRRISGLACRSRTTQATSRIAHLQKANAGVRFLSVEPLIAPIGSLDLRGIDWVIVGGESGPACTPDADRSGQSTFATSASRQAWRSSSSNGADAHPRPAGGCSRARSGISSLRIAAPVAPA